MENGVNYRKTTSENVLRERIKVLGGSGVEFRRANCGLACRFDYKGRHYRHAVSGPKHDAVPVIAEWALDILEAV